ncbi:YaaC family protein [Bacillus kwashiorkori]|uniref:YaaC family protein n=1 Tax=Bacillus kwashiorkori TaxID=1522318 RepID=UPI00078118CF|nr:YaaC family protein [Bacillus kwashiorkori]
MNYINSDKFSNDLLVISSAETARNFLTERYINYRFENTTEKSFNNCYPFIYYIEHGKDFFEQAKRSPLTMKPILLFYGFVFFIKACLLTVDPYYPETTSVLAHGVTTRKKKKQQYDFLKDEVKIQKSGLFPHFSKKMFHMEQLEGKKITVGDLLQQVPELMDFFKHYERIASFSIVEQKGNTIILPDKILDIFKMTKNRFAQFLANKSNIKIDIQLDNNITEINLKLNKSNTNYPIEILPLRYYLEKDTYLFANFHKEFCFFHELMIHYLILYHLSMIARYEIEWWAELIHHKSTFDYSIISLYLNIAMDKCLFLINQFLFNEQDLSIILN